MRAARGTGSERDAKTSLVCPDENCGQPMVTVERTKLRLTRLLRDAGGTNCCHFIPLGGTGRMTNEHLWLLGIIRDMCEDLGHGGHLEVDFAGVRVGAPIPYPLEVQRVSNIFTERTSQRRGKCMRFLWLLPETENQKNRSGNRPDPVVT